MRLIEGEFPNYQQVIPKQSDHHLTLSVEPLLHALRRVALLSAEHSRAVKLELSEGKLSSPRATPTSVRRRRSSTSTTPGPLSIGFNARYLLDCLGCARRQGDPARPARRRLTRRSPPHGRPRQRRRGDADAALARPAPRKDRKLRKKRGFEASNPLSWRAPVRYSPRRSSALPTTRGRSRTRRLQSVHRDSAAACAGRSSGELRREFHRGSGRPRAGPEAAGDVHRDHRPRRPPSPGLRGRRQLDRRGPRRLLPRDPRSPSTTTTRSRSWTTAAASRWTCTPPRSGPPPRSC